MKITIVQGAFLPVPPLLGGAVEKMWFLLAQEFVKHGHAVTHVSRRFRGLPNHETIAGVEHTRVSGYATPKRLVVLKTLDFFYSLAVVRKLPKADILISNTFWLPILSRNTRAGKLYVDVNRVPRGQMKFYTNASVLRACSRAIEAHILEELPSSKHQLVSYIPNPFPINSSVSESDIPKKKKEIIFVGRIHPEKGLNLLMEAIRAIDFDCFRGWRVKIFGPASVKEGGGGDNYLKFLSLQVEDRSFVSFEGAIYDTDALKKVYEDASIMVYPTVADKGEAAPVAPGEAMTCGCVPIVSNIPQLSDLIVDGENGLVFNWKGSNAGKKLADKLLFLMQNQVAREKMARKALGVQKTHSINSIAVRFLEDFERIIQHD